tara:strand:- start:17007 stop:18284 length:1278 start_codon:yes stop_codon:yes gene_type:complete
MQTAHFSEEEFDLKVLDCIAEKLETKTALAQISTYSPDFIIGQIGSVSLEEDAPFYYNIKKQLPDVSILASGDALLENHEELLQQWPWLDAIITNFFNDGSLKWITGDFTKASGIVFRNENGTKTNEATRISNYEMAVPKHHLFDKRAYRMPFANALPIATVLTNYACPYPCTFCIMSTMPYMTRSAESIISELKEIKELGYKYIYFSDQTFFMSKLVSKAVLKWMIESNFGIKWMCFSRVDVLGEEEIGLMKQAGCNLIMFGVEFADEDYLIKYKKNYTLEQIRNTFQLTAKAGIKRLGTFLIGVPGQSKDSILRTIQFAKEIDADYASFNIAVPRSNTSFREEAIEAGIIDESLKVMDQSGDEVTMGTGILSKRELQKLKLRAYRLFYFRPHYLIKRLISINSSTEFKVHVREGWHIFKALIS